MQFHVESVRKSSKEIDKMNIRNTVSSMNHALLNLNPENLPTIVYVDGDHLKIKQTGITIVNLRLLFKEIINIYK